MRRVKRFCCFLIILSAVILSGSNAYAQNVFKTDVVKTNQKFTIWVQQQSENFQKSIKEISESQFGSFVGKGVEAAKKGIKFAKDTYSNVKEKVDDVKNSDAYKIALK